MPAGVGKTAFAARMAASDGFWRHRAHSITPAPVLTARFSSRTGMAFALFSFSLPSPAVARMSSTSSCLSHTNTPWDLPMATVLACPRARMPCDALSIVASSSDASAGIWSTTSAAEMKIPGGVDAGSSWR